MAQIYFKVILKKRSVRKIEVSFPEGLSLSKLLIHLGKSG